MWTSSRPEWWTPIKSPGPRCCRDSFTSAWTCLFSRLLQSHTRYSARVCHNTATVGVREPRVGVKNQTIWARFRNRCKNLLGPGNKSDPLENVLKGNKPELICFFWYGRSLAGGFEGLNVLQFLWIPRLSRSESAPSAFSPQPGNPDQNAAPHQMGIESWRPAFSHDSASSWANSRGGKK